MNKTQLVLDYILERVNDDGWKCPTYKELSNLLSVSVREISKIILIAEGLGIINRDVSNRKVFYPGEYSIKLRYADQNGEINDIKYIKHKVDAILTRLDVSSAVPTVKIEDMKLDDARREVEERIKLAQKIRMGDIESSVLKPEMSSFFQISKCLVSPGKKRHGLYVNSFTEDNISAALMSAAIVVNMRARMYNVPKKIQNTKRFQECIRDVKNFDSRMFEWDYSIYLKSEHWKSTRHKKLNEVSYCEKCGRNDVELIVHHKNYSSFFNESMDDLLVLCRKHHEEKHNMERDIDG